MEDVNGLNEASQTLHDAANSPGHALIACPTVGCQNGYNTYSVIINRTNTSAEYLEYVMDGVVEDTITEASVGTTAWQEAIDHGFYIIFDLAMGGNYPDGISGETTPTSATTSRRVDERAVRRGLRGGRQLHPARDRDRDRAGHRRRRPVPGQQGRPGRRVQPGHRRLLRRRRRPAVVPLHRRHRPRPRAAASTWSPPGPPPAPTSTGIPATAPTPRTGPTKPTGSWRTRTPGLCLTDPGGNPSGQLELEACTDSAAQVWNLPVRRHDRQHRHRHHPGQPDVHRRHRRQPPGRRQRLRVRPDPHLQRHRPAGRAVDQRLHRPDLRHPDHRGHLARHGHRDRHHRR